MAYFSSKQKQQQLVWLLLIIWSSSLVFGPYKPQLLAEAMSCDEVSTYVAKCVPYVQRRSGRVDHGCCSGIKAMAAAAKTTPDRQDACYCLKTIAASVGNVDYKRAALLPARCLVFGPYKVSPSTDCSEIR